MYYLIVLSTTAVLPILSVAVEHLSRPEADLALLLGKWFTFWAAGVRRRVCGAFAGGAEDGPDGGGGERALVGG